MKSHIKPAALAIVMIVSSSVVDAQDAPNDGESAWHNARAMDQRKAR